MKQLAKEWEEYSKENPKLRSGTMQYDQRSVISFLDYLSEKYNQE